MPPSVSFVVPTFRRPETLAEVVRRIRAVDYPSVQLVVVDDSDGASVDAIDPALLDGVTVVRQDRRGAAAARNAGARASDGELLIFCDDDILVEPDHVHRHLLTRSEHGDDVLVNGRWEYAPKARAELESTAFGRYRLQLDTHYRHADAVTSLGNGCIEVPVVVGANLAVSRSVFEALDGFDEEFPYAGAEDAEFSIRAAESGRRLLRDDRIEVLHEETLVTFERFTAGQERAAETRAVLERRHPDRAEAAPLQSHPGMKAILSRPRALRALHGLIGLLERLHAPSALLERLYAGVHGLHLFRGFRRGMA